jgi:hypothetical protein
LYLLIIHENAFAVVTANHGGSGVTFTGRETIVKRPAAISVFMALYLVLRGKLASNWNKSPSIVISSFTASLTP